MCDIGAFPNEDTIKLYIENDGTITITTPGISKEIHKTAEEFLKMLANELGATVETHQHKPQHAHHTTKVQSTIKTQA